MSKMLKKSLYMGAAALMLAGFGANASQANVHVHASQISRLKARKAHDYKDIANINRQLAKLQRNHKRSNKRVNHHYSKAFRQGYNDMLVRMNTKGGEGGFTKKLMHNPQYKKGYIYGSMHANKSSKVSYKEALSNFNEMLHSNRGHHRFGYSMRPSDVKMALEGNPDAVALH